MRCIVCLMLIIALMLITGCSDGLDAKRDQCIGCCESNPEFGASTEFDYDCKGMCEAHINPDINEQGIQSTLDMFCN